VAKKDAAGYLVCAVGEDVRLDPQDVAGDTLDGEAAAIDLRVDVLDYDAATLGGVGSG